MNYASHKNSNKVHQEPIAIVGIGCRFPGNISGADTFWDFLKNQGDAIGDIPKDRWNIESFYDPNPDKAGKIKARKGGFLNNIKNFDANFFNIFPNEAQRIDPQQRLLLEVAYEAMEDAGIPLDKISGSKTGVYMGVFMNDYWDIQASTLQRDNISPQVPMGVSLTAIANRLSYVYNLKGPSMTIDTACSSSLVCVHLACQSIWNGESEQALAGGVNLIIRPESSIMMSKGNFLSPDGYCKSFDSRANGYVRSEGSGVIVLKPYSKALSDGDQIYALVRGSAVNQDGFTEDGFTVPSAAAQTEMLKTAYQSAGVEPKKVVYVEAHGTGTPVGDPIETSAFGSVIGEGRSEEDTCVIGSVKSNIGHLEAAAGIAGLIKLSLILKNRQIPANLHFQKPNPKIPFDKYRLRVPTSLENINKEGTIFGGVNSFGAGGTNAHIVLSSFEEIPKASNEPEYKEDNTFLFLVSGKSKEALKANANAYIEFLGTTSETFKDICYTSIVRRTHSEHKLMISARSKAELVQHLEAFLKEETRPSMNYITGVAKTKPKVGFVYSGQGPQWYAMGRELMVSSPVFRKTVLDIEELFKKVSGWSLLEEMNKDEATSRISDTRVAQPAIMAIQIGLTELWKSWGINPDGIVGHSIGEVAAAYAAGSLSLSQAVEVIYHRSRGQNKATDKGKMLAVGLSHSEALKAIAGFEKQISIAAVNGPNMVALAGDNDALEIVDAKLQAKEVFTRYLKVNVPFHSHHMEPLKDELIASLKHLKPEKSKIDLYSTVTGKLENGEHLLSEYWYANVRETVFFSDAVQQMISDGYDLFLEIAPHPILSVGVNELFALNKVKHGQIIPSLRRGSDEMLTIQSSLGLLCCLGVNIDWNNFFGAAKFVKTPTYQWQHQEYWFENNQHLEQRLGRVGFPFVEKHLKSAVGDYCEMWEIAINKATHLFLEDHKVEGTIIFPGTGHLEVALQVAKYSHKDKYTHLADINLEAALFLPEEGEAPEIRLEITNDEGNYNICSRTRGNHDEAWTRNSNGKIVVSDRSITAQQFPLADYRKRISEPMSISDFYFELKEGGLNYGETFRCAQKIWTGDKEVLAALSLPDSLNYEAASFFFHPALLDACLHTLFAARKSTTEEKRGIYLPVHIKEYHYYQKPNKNVWVYIDVLEASAEFLKGNYTILNEDETVVAEIKGLTCKYIEGSRKEQKDETYKGMYAYEWEEVEQSIWKKEGEVQAQKYLIFADHGEQYLQLLKQIDKDCKNSYVVKKGYEFSNGISNHLRVNPKDTSELQKVFTYLTDKQFKYDKIIVLWALDSKLDKNSNACELQQQQDELTQTFLNLLKTLVEQPFETPVYIINQGLENILSEDEIQLAHAALNGLSRVMINEFPFIPMNMIGFGKNLIAQDWETFAYVLALDKKNHFPELSIRGEKIYQRKLKAVLSSEAEEKYSNYLPAQSNAFRASVSEYGLMDSIKFRSFNRRKPKSTEVEIEVKSAGLNFKDVMNIMGFLSDEAVVGGVAGKNLGLECAGVITAVGSEVKNLKVGDEVMAWASDSFAGYTVTEEACVVKKPSHLSFEQAASIPVTFLTAHYSLNYLAQIEEGESILIHSATGGVGLAAIQFAKLKGLEIFATAGTEEKRNILKSMGIKHVFDSRNLDFSDRILEITAGKGVDVVLNSLSGKAISYSIKCLSPFGRFIEIGKADVYRDAKLALKRFGNNLSLHVVDLDRLMLQKPKLGKKMFEELCELFAQQLLSPVAISSYPIQNLSQALGQLSKGTHIGKFAVNNNAEAIQVFPARELFLYPDATYLVTGGASGFGLELGIWLANKGAKNLVLVSRSGCKTEEDKNAVQKLKDEGVNVLIWNANISDFNEVNSLVKKINEELPPLRGIIHSAAVLKDATFKTMDQKRFEEVYHPKVLGAYNFHLVTQPLELDFFLMLSSISSIFGLPGQSNYSAANNFLDKLAEFRQQQGQAASSVNLGVLGLYAGMSKEGEQVLKVLANQGWYPLSLKQVTDKIENILLQQPTYRMAANIDWKRFKDFFAHLQDDSRFSEIIKLETGTKNNGAKGGVGLTEQITQLPKEEQAMFLQNKIVESLAKILGTSADRLDINISISKIGLDSLMLNQLRNWIQQKLEINFPLMRIAKGPSIVELAEQLLNDLNKLEESSSAVVQDTSGIGFEEDIEIVNQWLVRRKNSNPENVHTRIFCIHPVGAGASMFSHFMYHAPKNTEVMAFQLPGRENRIAEPHFEDVNLLIKEMATAMREFLDTPFIIMGHSFGGILGYELIKYLKREFELSPIHLFISGTIAPQLTKKWKERDVISQTAIFSNSEERLLSLMSYIDDVEFLKKILPVMRKDMPLIMNYMYQESEKLDIPISAYAADKDEVVHAQEVAQWAEQTSAGFELEVVPGDHWFLSRNRDQVLERLNKVAKLEIVG